MGVPGFYSWLTKRYPLIKHMVGKQSLPQIDYLYLDMNGIIYKCVKDDSVIFKSQILPKEFEQIWIEVFNYINMIVNLLKPTKMVFLALDGVAPRSKMNNQRSRRFKSARDYKQYIEKFYGYNQDTNTDSQQNFKNNSISPGTKFMEELNQMIHFFVQKKIQQDEYWKSISVIFTGSDCPGQGQHKIMQWIRTNKASFQPDDNHCLYGADADLIMLGLTLPMKNICIIREQYIHSGDKVKIKDTKKQKVVKFQMIFLTILKQYFEVQYGQIRDQMKNVQYNIINIIKDFVLLFFFIGNDFLPRCMAYNIRQKSIQKLIAAFKIFLIDAEDYVVGDNDVGENGIFTSKLNLKQLARLVKEISKFQATFVAQKVEDAQKFIEKKNEFQDQFTQAMKQKVMKQGQFLNQLKQFYMNQDQDVRNGYYKTKFNVDPAENTQQFYTVLGFYLHGIKFVYQYYFQNLSSWSWYYPYYYAPLLSDLSIYLDYLVQSGTQLQALERGQPFNPFKQLLCILPKQSSDLLPESMRKYLTSNEGDSPSPLRQPIDYYPDHFQDDLYGSTRSHEAVSLIPFLDQQIIERVYKQGLLNIKDNQKGRNVFHLTKLYEYSSKGQHNLTKVNSPLSVINSFQCPIVIQQIKLLETHKWKTMNLKPLNCLSNQQEGDQQTVLYRMPTLRMRDFEAIVCDNAKRSLKYQLEVIQPNYDNKSNQEKKLISMKLGSVLFYGYPLQHSGRIQGILTRQSIQMGPDFLAINYDLDYISKDFAENWMLNKRTKELFFDLIDNRMKKDFSYLNLSNTQTLVFVKDTQYFNRTLQGGFKRVYVNQNKSQNYAIVPLGLVSKNKKYTTTKTNFKFASLKEQFPINTEAIFASPNTNLCGSKCEVIGYVGEEKVKVRVTEPLKRLKNEKLFKIVNTDEVFLDLKFVSQIIGFKYDIILTILDTVSIQLPRQKNLPQSIDIGLNFISRQDKQIVPNLVRINFQNSQVSNEDPKRIYKYLQLSVKAFQMLLQYKQKYNQVLKFIQERHYRLIDQSKRQQKAINWRQKIRAQDIFQDDGKSKGKHQETTRQLMKVYLWLIKNKQTHMPMSSIFSKQISYKKISKLQEYFKVQFPSGSQRKKGSKQLQELKGKQYEVDPNFLYSLQLSRKGFLYLSKRPQDHTVGDQIVCLHPEHFGHFGVVIGVDDDKYQVIFAKPSFGKGDLNGLCTNLWGGKFRFKELLNLDLWPKYFAERKNSEQSLLQNVGWVDTMIAFTPKFKTKPIKNFNDFQLFIQNKELVKIFHQQTIAYILKSKQQLNQIEIDKDYQVVDNAQQDYHYKYDKKQTTVNQKQVEQLGKNKKWMQKGINQDGEGVKKENFQKEVIENKLKDLTLEETTQTKEKTKEDTAVATQQVPTQKKSNEDVKPKKYEEKKTGPIKYQQKPKYQQKKAEQSKKETQETQAGFKDQEDAEDMFG